MKQQASSSLKKNTADYLTDKIQNYAANRYVNLEELESINQLFIETRNNLTSDQINDIVSSYSQIEVINPTFLIKEVLPFILKNQNLLSLLSQIKISHLFAKKDLYSEKLCQQLVSIFINSSESLSSSELIDLQWNLSKLRYFDQNFFQEWKNRIIPHISSLENHDLSKSVLAIAKNDYFSEDLIHEFVNTLKERDLNNPDLTDAIYGLSLIMTTKNQPSLQAEISELIAKVNPSSFLTVSDIRKLISSYNSLSPFYKEPLTNIQPTILDRWNDYLREGAQKITSHSQSLIRNLLLKYDPEAQEEVWFEPLATNVDIYLPSIRTYVQVDGPTHFYRNDPSHYTTTSQFNSSFLEKEDGKHLLRISNLNPRSYHKVISRALNDRFFESSNLTTVTSAVSDINIETSFPLPTEEITTSSVAKEESAIQSNLTYTSSKKKKKTSNLKMQASEDPFLTITEAVGSTTNHEIKDYKDKISHLTKMHKIERKPDYYNNIFQLAVDRMDFELASHLIANYNITKIDNFLEFIKKEASNENFINHPQFEHLVEIFNTAIKKNIFNEFNLMGIMIQNENIIKFIALTNYDFNKRVIFPDGSSHNAASFMLMETGYFDTVNSLIKNEKLTHTCDQQITLPLVLCAVYYDPKNNNNKMTKQRICLETLLENNFSAEVYDIDFTTPILYCFTKATENIITNNELYEHYINLGNILLSHNVSIAVKPLKHGGNLLHAAVATQHEELVSKLLKINLPYGIDDFSHDPKGQNTPPIYLSISLGNLKISELLLQNGANPEGEYDVKEMVITKTSSSIDKSPIYIKKNQTPLFIAAELETPELINLLVKYGADINRPNKIGLTVMHKIIQRKTYSLCESVIQNGFYDDKSFKMLLERAQDCPEEVKSQIRTYQSDPVSFILQAETLDQDKKIRSLTALSNAKSLPEEHKAKALNEIDLLQNNLKEKYISIVSNVLPAQKQGYAEKIMQERLSKKHESLANNI